MATYVFPTSAEMEEIAQDLMPSLTQDRPIFDIMPIRPVDEHLLIWELLDNFTGLQAVRGLDGMPGRVNPVSLKQYEMQPGIYGDFSPITETDITTRRMYGTFGTPVDLTTIVMERQNQLLQRRLNRIEYIGWTLLSTGTFAVSAANGSILHTDTFTLQNVSGAVSWGTFATATPLADFRSVQLLARGHSVDFGAGAVAYMNRHTSNNLLSNTNANDLYGRRTTGLATINNLQGVNTLLTGDDLPTVKIYDQGYLDDSGVFHNYIPDSTVIVVGKRPAGQPVAEYRMTRNSQNPDLAPGAYMRVIDSGEYALPRKIEVHDGHNGGPVLYFGTAICVMSV